MGGDGQALNNIRGVLEKFKYYRNPTEDEKEDSSPSEKRRRIERWTHCSLSLIPLEFPAAFDLGGLIYTKQSVVTFLLDRKKNNDMLDDQEAQINVRKLSDVCEIANPIDDGSSISCPVTGFSTVSGIHTFVGLWRCGHVVSATLVDGLVGDEVECPVCDVKGFVVPLLVDDKESTKQRQFLRGKVHGKKRHRE